MIKALVLRFTLSCMFSFLLINHAYAETCSTEKCHPQIATKVVVHAPVKSGDCVVCHIATTLGHPDDTPANDFSFAADGKKLCYTCHLIKETEKIVHDPIAKGTCTACHNPHQSNVEKLLNKETTSELCYSCHKENYEDNDFIHGPVAVGDCNICHNPHSSQNKNLLEEKGRELCFECHLDLMDEFQMKYSHKPATEECTKCHNPHSSQNKYMLIKSGRALCFTCHIDIKKKVQEAHFLHAAQAKVECTSCHTPHASNYPRQMKLPVKQACYDCHKKMGKKVLKSKNIHGPIVQNDCYACHDPHGSPYTKFLHKMFPSIFYMPYSVDHYSMCFDCHNKDISTDAETTTLTSFRNGDQNLHYLHVNREKGRSCKACHEIHAGGQEKHVRSEVPFGKKFNIKVTFTKTATGGGCVVGCHKPKEYDRENPVESTEKKRTGNR